LLTSAAELGSSEPPPKGSSMREAARAESSRWASDVDARVRYSRGRSLGPALSHVRHLRSAPRSRIASYDLESNHADDRLLYPSWGVFGSGACVAFMREWFVAGCGFDPASDTGQDAEALSAAVLRGERLVYEPRSLSLHANHREDAALRRHYGVGFTAILTKALPRDRRFCAAVARSMQVAPELHGRRLSQSPDSCRTLPPDLARLQRPGMLWGHERDARGATWPRSLGLDRVIRGE